MIFSRLSFPRISLVPLSCLYPLPPFYLSSPSPPDAERSNRVSDRQKKYKTDTDREMASSRERSFLTPALLLLLLAVAKVASGRPLPMEEVARGRALAPALIIFGDSAMDVGNNDHISTIVKADFPPYGRDFPHRKPTGRFCNGKLAVDFMAERLGIQSYPPAYLSKHARGKNLLIGANFASASSGYLESTALLYHTVSLNQQVTYYKEYQRKAKKMAKNKTASDAIFSKGLHLLSAGSSDLLQNYYINPLYHLLQTPAQFFDLLLSSFSSFVKDIYGMGARRVGVFSLPPIGCMPASITLYSPIGSGECVERLNRDAKVFNKRLGMAARALEKQLSELKLVVLDIYQPVFDLVTNASTTGFYETRRGCCGTGTVETSVLCNSKSIGTCQNAKSYIFWDSIHLTEAANRILADSLMTQAIHLVSD